MSLGYVLLHPSRLEISLHTPGGSRFLHETSDVVFGGIGVASDLGTGFEDYVEGRARWFQDLLARFRELAELPGPFDFLRAFAADPPQAPDFAALLDRLPDLPARWPAFKEELRTWLHGLVDTLPGGFAASITVHLREQFDAVTEILETPLRGGRQDRDAVRGFRAAVTLRQVFGPLFEHSLTAAASLDIKALLLRFIDDLLERLKGPDLDRLSVVLGDLKTQLGGIVQAFAHLSASFSVSVSVGGPQGAPGDPTADELEKLAAPDPPGHWLWVMDLVTGIFATFTTLWEMVRTGNWKGRGLDGVLNVIGILWQATRTVLRAAFREQINARPDEQDGGRIFGNWMLSDQGNLAVNLLLRLLGSAYEMPDASTNWAMNFVPSMLKFYSNTVNTRVFYWSARSFRYFQQRKAENVTTPAPFLSTMWAIWGPWWTFSSLFGLFPAWEDFTLEDGLTQPRTLATLIVGLALGVGAGYLTLGLINDVCVDVAPDWWTLGTMSVLWLLGLIGITIFLTGLESKDTEWVTILFIVVAILLGLAFIALGIVFGKRATGGFNKFLLHFILFVGGLVTVGLLPYFLWWFYIDDGRDKYGYFADLPADLSPYKLPYRAGESWYCSQGVHGLFSHYLVPLDGSKSDNHYSYDFNEAPHTPALAVRGGVVISYTDDIPTDAPNRPGATGFAGNNVSVLHLDWIDKHDPGSDSERVLTYGEYVHQPQNGIRADTGHRMVQGYHLCNIDSTGRSAVHHLHLNVAEVQRTVEVTVPFVFSDSTIRRFRNFPLITSWASGGWHIDGKPMSMAFYESENAEQGPVLNPIRIQTADAGTPPHSHFLELDRRTLGTGALPDSVTLSTTGIAPPAGSPAGTPTPTADHVHTVTLTRADVLKLLALESPEAFALTAANGHTHGFGAVVRRRGSAPQPTLTVTDPPPGQLLATRPFPYRLLGEQLVLRVNGRATDYVLYGAHRPALLADVAVERALRSGSALLLNGTSRPLSGSSDASARGGVLQLNTLLAGAGVQVVARAVPTIVLETRRRGRTAALQMTFQSASAAAAGTGVFDDLAAVPVSDLVNHLNAILQNGWPAAPAALSVTLAGGLASMSLGGALVDLSASSSRLARVLTGLYETDPTSPDFQLLRTVGAMPLGTGRVVFGGGTPWPAPLLATPAEVRVDTAHAAFAGPSPLQVTVLGKQHDVVLDSDTPADIARRISLAVEGVRAWAEGDDVVVQTVAGGSDLSLVVRKDAAAGAPFQASSTGATAVLSPPLPLASALSDSAVVLPETLVGVVDDARARATLPYNPVVVGPVASLDAGKLVVEVSAGQTISFAGAGFTGDPPFTFTPVTPERLETAVLPATISLRGPAWIDFLVAGQPVRVPIDGEAARVDLPPLDRMPAATDTLQVSIDGGAPLNVPFTGTEADVFTVADTVAQASDEIVVRIAWTISVENSLYGSPGNLTLGASSALSEMGFLRAPAGLVANAIGVGSDQMSVSAIAAAYRENGVPVVPVTVTEASSAGDLAWALAAPPGFQVMVTPTQVGSSAPDPLGFPAAAAAGVSTAFLPPTVGLGAQCHEYLLEVIDAAGGVFARTYTQIAAEPAAVRSAATPVGLPVSATPSVIQLTVTAPGAGDRTYAVDMSGLATLDHVAEALNALTPDLRAWVVRPATLLHVETAGGGSGWRLRLDNLPALFELGFDRTGMDLAAGTLTAVGGGTAADGRAVTRDEIRAAFQRAVQGATAVLASRSLTVTPDGANVVLRSLEGAVTVETEPPSLRASLNVTETPDRATLAPGAALNVDNGSVIVKVQERTVAVSHIWGRPAAVRGDLDVTALSAPDQATMLALLQSHSLRLSVQGALHLLPAVPGSATTLADALEFLAGQAPEVWLGIRQGIAVVESRVAGSASSLTVDFSDFATGGVYPPGTVLGFAGTQLNAAFEISAAGDGSVPDRRAVPVLGSAPSLIELLRTAAGEAASPQAVYEALVDSTAPPARIRLRTHLPGTTLSHTTTPLGPDSIPFSPPRGGTPGSVLEAPYPAAQPIEPGVFTLTTGPAARAVTALVAAQAARLPALQRPTTLQVLNGTGFDLAVGAASFPVRLIAGASTTDAEIAAQIERQCLWTVRAALDATALRIETVESGSAKSITLSAPPAPVTNAITGNPTTGFTAPSPLPMQANGAGAVPAMEAVTAADLQSVLSRAYIAARGGGGAVTYGSRSLDWRSYDALDAVAPPLQYLTITAPGDGCASAVEPLIDLAPVLALSRSLERAPAIRGSVVLPAFTGAKPLSGTLHVQLNDNQGIADLAGAVVVPVSFPAGDYTARQVAERIDAELFEREIGRAAAYADGTVVVETSLPGLTGSVRIPAPGTGTAGPDQALLQQLLGPVRELFGRGWPGSGFGAVRGGLRSRRGNATANNTLRFTSGAGAGAPSVTVTVTAGQSLADVQRAIDSALAGAPGGRLGWCLLGDDETLYVEEVAGGLMFDFPTASGLPLPAPPAWPVRQPARPGDTPELIEEPAVGFRLTNQIRTVRYARDRFGNSVEAEFDDVRWVRVPAGTDGFTVAALSFPSGIFWTAGRTAASKTRDYDASGEMIVSAGADDPATPTRFFVHRARFWLGLTGGSPLRVVRNSAGEFLLEVLL